MAGANTTLGEYMRKTTFAAAAFLGLTFLGLPLRASEIPEKDFARRDLIAQEGMNRGTSGIMVLTFMQMILAGAGTVAVVASLEMSRRALRQAQVSAEIQRETAREQLRAYLGGEEPIVERFDDTGLKINFPIKNFGATPARNVQIWSYSNVIRGALKSFPVPMPNPEDFRGRRSIIPNGTMGWYCSAEYEIGDNVKGKIEGMAVSFIGAYLIRYEDIFGRTHYEGRSEIRTGLGLQERNVNSAFMDSIHALMHDETSVPQILREGPTQEAGGHFDWLRNFVAESSSIAPAESKV